MLYSDGGKLFASAVLLAQVSKYLYLRMEKCFFVGMLKSLNV
jgi:hypothetical protein